MMRFARPYVAAIAVALSALAALAVNMRAPVAPPRDVPATEQPAARVQAGHALVGEYVRMTVQARLAADRAADAEFAANRRLAGAETAMKLAAAMPKAEKPRGVTSAVPLPEPAPPVLAPPLPLQAPVRPVSAPHKRPVVERVVATVERIPNLVRSGIVGAATWVVELPGQAVARLPERRFL